MMAEEVVESTDPDAWMHKIENILPQLDRVSQLPLFSKVYKDIKKKIIDYLPEYRGDLSEKHCPRVQADIIEDLKKIAWENDTRVCRNYIYCLHNIASTGAPFTELIEKINVKLNPLVQSFKNKETFIKAMGKVEIVRY